MSRSLILHEVRVKKFFEQNRILACLGLANWSILLTGSPWLDNPCTCRTRSVYLSDSQSEFPVLAIEAKNPWTLTTQVQCCHNEERRTVLTSLAVTMAELALLRPSTSDASDEINLLQGVHTIQPILPSEVVKFCLSYRKRAGIPQLESYRIEELKLFDKAIFRP